MLKVCLPGVQQLTLMCQQIHSKSGSVTAPQPCIRGGGRVHACLHTQAHSLHSPHAYDRS